jgi:DNA-binding ferritin-like protein
MDHLLKTAVLLRGGQLYAHHCHNNVKGLTFSQDHDFFGDLYPAYEAAYDGCVERYIGLTGKPADTIQLGCDALDLVGDLPKDCGENNHAFYQGVLHVEVALCKYIESCIKAPMSEGTKQMLGNLADESEVRQYKIKQRLKG